MMMSRLSICQVLVCVVVLSPPQDLFVCASYSTSASASDKERSIAILALAPYAVSGRWDDPDLKAGPALIPAVRLAVDRINNRTDLLPGYHIQLLEGNSGCQHISRTAYEFFSHAFHDNGQRLSLSIVGVIGPACSESAQFLGSLGTRDRISFIQLSPLTTSPLLADTVQYSNTFRMLGTAVQHIGALTQLLTLNSWENVAVLYDNSHQHFHAEMEILLTSLSSKIAFNAAIDSTYYPLERIKEHKVILLYARSQHARQVICLAYYHQPRITYPLYQWIITNEIKSTLANGFTFTYNNKLYNCTQEVMMEALEGAIMTSYKFLTQDLSNQTTDVDLTTEQYPELYLRYLQKHIDELTHDKRDTSYRVDAEKYAMPYYDATWALALALNASLERISPAILTSSGIHQPHTTEIIKQELNRLEFTGLMGNTSFQNGTQDTVTPIAIHQSIKGENTLIGVYNGAELHMVTPDVNHVLGVFHHEVISVHPVVAAVFLVLVVIITLSTISLHTIFIVFRKRKSIKAASFTTSHFMFSGCYLILLQSITITSVFSYSWPLRHLQEAHEHDAITGILCNINEWLNILGMSLILATLCGNLWRIYRIFHYFRTKSYLISDYALTAFIVVIVGINMVLLTVWNTVDPLLAEIEQQDIGYNGEDEPVLLVKRSCHCRHFTLWISAIHSVLLFVLTCVVILSSLNRRISRRYFQTAKSVNMIVYIISPACFLNGLVFLFQSLDIHYTYVLWQISILSIVSFVCMFIFTLPAFNAFSECFKPFCQR